MKYYIKLKKEHIKTGSGGCSRFCPIALAIRESLHLEKYDSVHVTEDHIAIEGGGFEVPKRVKNFINNYDEGKENLRGFAFTLEN